MHTLAGVTYFGHVGDVAADQDANLRQNKVQALHVSVMIACVSDDCMCQ